MGNIEFWDSMFNCELLDVKPVGVITLKLITKILRERLNWLLHNAQCY